MIETGNLGWCLAFFTLTLVLSYVWLLYAMVTSSSFDPPPIAPFTTVIILTAMNWIILLAISASLAEV